MSDTATTDLRKLAERRKELASWALDASGMAKSGYAPRKAELARWVVDLAREILVALDRVAALEQERDLAAKAARDQAAGVGYQAAHTFAAESRLAAYREAADRLAEAHSTIKSRAVTRRIAVHVDGTAEWANPLIREVHDIAAEALSVYAALWGQDG